MVIADFAGFSDDRSRAMRGFRPAFAANEATFARDRRIVKWRQYIPPGEWSENVSDDREISIRDCARLPPNPRRRRVGLAATATKAR
jgi:hypothetical protein